MAMHHSLRSATFCATLCALAAAPLLAAGPAQAEMVSGWSAPSGTAVRLLAGPVESGTLTGGVEIRLDPGWKTYWRYPGDSGMPPRFDWSGSRNVGSVEILWPAPVRFDEGGSLSIGYKRDVVIPFRVTPAEAGKPVDLRLDLDFAVCERICQPASASLTLDVPAGGTGATPAPLAASLATVPHMASLGAAGSPAIARAVLDGGTIRVETQVAHADKADLFVEGPNDDWALPLPSREAGADGRTVFVLPVDGVPKGADIASARLRFTLVDGSRAIEVESPLSAR